MLTPLDLIPKLQNVGCTNLLTAYQITFIECWNGVLPWLVSGLCAQVVFKFEAKWRRGRL